MKNPFTYQKRKKQQELWEKRIEELRKQDPFIYD